MAGVPFTRGGTPRHYPQCRDRASSAGIHGSGKFPLVCATGTKNMTIWQYGHANRLVTLELAAARDCAYCSKPLLHVPPERFEASGKVLLAQVSICVICGWWVVYRVHQNEYERTAGLAEGYSATVGSLVELDVSDLSVPLTELNQYLLARSEALYDVHPRKLEELVASVFDGEGWRARVTGCSGDRGIDVVLERGEGEVVGVQVKRYARHRRIEAEQIRAFTGALVLSGQTMGVFVATFGFRKGAREAAAESAARGFPIELVDANRFLEALGARRVEHFSLEPEKLASYVLHAGAHVGTGLHTELTPGENLAARQIVLRAFTHEELVGADDV